MFFDIFWWLQFLKHFIFQKNIFLEHILLSVDICHQNFTTEVTLACRLLVLVWNVYLQLNLHETNLLFRYLSHLLTWHCFRISEELQRFARNLQHMIAKLFLLLFLNNFAIICCKFLANRCKSSDILKQYDVKRWLNYRKYGSVWYSFSFTYLNRHTKK